MVERQDIDALLIGSLYGELSSAEEARLAAHLESHPADRTALANLSRAREVVRESRILQVQFEPPHSISALLVQEAARRAPKPREEQGWFQRFMRSFMAHPAMAAAMMLVLIVGVAGTVYLKKGDHFAKQTKDDESAGYVQDTRAPAVASPEGKLQGEQANTTAVPGLAGSAAGSAATANSAPADNFQVQLDEQSLKQAEDKAATGADRNDRTRDQEVLEAKKNKAGELAFEANSERRAQKTKAEISKETATRDADSPLAQPKAPDPKVTSKPVAKKSPPLEVSTPTQAPKDFEAPAKAPAKTVAKPSRGAPSNEKLDGVAVGGANAPGTGAAGASQSRAPTVAEPKPAPPPPPAAPAEEREKQVDPQLAWAKEQHGKVIAAVKAGNCQTAANIAVQISNRAPAYYASNVETDRTLKQCMQYITAQREKEVERAQRAKAASQRRTVDEAPSKPATSTK